MSLTKILSEYLSLSKEDKKRFAINSTMSDYIYENKEIAKDRGGNSICEAYDIFDNQHELIFLKDDMSNEEFLKTHPEAVRSRYI